MLNQAKGKRGWLSVIQDKAIMLLALNGKMTTWDLALKDPDVDKKSSYSGTRRYDVLRQKSSEYARAIRGRHESNKGYPGLMGRMLVVEDGYRESKGQRVSTYRLSLFGVLYAIHLLRPLARGGRQEDISSSGMVVPKTYLDIIAENYRLQLPHVFGLWDLLKEHLKEQIGHAVEELDNIADGHLNIGREPLMWLLTTRGLPVVRGDPSDIRTRMRTFEPALADEISYWFWTNLSLRGRALRMDIEKHQERLLEVMKSHASVREWYLGWLNYAEEKLLQARKDVNSLKSRLTSD